MMILGDWLICVLLARDGKERARSLSRCKYSSTHVESKKVSETSPNEERRGENMPENLIWWLTCVVVEETRWRGWRRKCGELQGAPKLLEKEHDCWVCCVKTGRKTVTAMAGRLQLSSPSWKILIVEVSVKFERMKERRGLVMIEQVAWRSRMFLV